MAAIDFTYSSWIMMALQKHISAWQVWNKSNSHITVVLPPPTIPASTTASTTAGCSKNQTQSAEDNSEIEILQNTETNPVQTEVTQN